MIVLCVTSTHQASCNCGYVRTGPPPGAYAYTTAAAPTPAQSVLPVLAKPVVPVPNLLDEDDDSVPAPVPAPNLAPPRPPNPELLRLHEQVRNKLAGELASLAHAHALDAERLRAHQRDLLAGEPAIRDESARLTAVRDVCGGVAARLRGAVQAAEANVAELRRKGDPPVDELVCAPSIVHNQYVFSRYPRSPRLPLRPFRPPPSAPPQPGRERARLRPCRPVVLSSCCPSSVVALSNPPLPSFFCGETDLLLSISLSTGAPCPRLVLSSLCSAPSPRNLGSLCYPAISLLSLEHSTPF